MMVKPFSILSRTVLGVQVGIATLTLGMLIVISLVGVLPYF
jgi:hypothetical protein